MSLSDQEKLIKKLKVFKIQGRDKRGHKILRIIGKYFPAKLVSGEVLKKYLEETIFPQLGDELFSVLYVHTSVQRSENFPGISTLRSIYDAIPSNVKKRLENVFFLHAGIQARLFLATLGRLIFTGWVYRKVKYVNRVEFMWDHVRRNEMKLPEFVYEEDEEMECRRTVDYGLESDYPRLESGSPMFDSPVGCGYVLHEEYCVGASILDRVCFLG